MSEESKLMLEDKLELLMENIEGYNKLSDEEKIQNIDLYNKLSKENNECIDLLNMQKNLLLIINEDSKIKKNYDNTTFITLTSTIKKINDQLNNNENLPLEKLINMYDELCIARNQLEIYFQTKRLTIINL